MIDNEEMILYIIRGIPGSGKTTLAKKLAPDSNYAADDYFYDSEGNYKFDVTKLDAAHKWCYKSVENAMINGVPVIAVNNTFVRKWEYADYIEMAEKLGYRPVEIICRGNFGSVHNVPSAKIKSMAQNFEY